MLANIYLNKLDRIWSARCRTLGVLVRYADDFVAMCRTESQAREALRRIGWVMNRLGLKLLPEKTRMVNLKRGKESFVFLGCPIRKKRSIQRNPRLHFMQRWPSPKAMKRIRERVHELTDSRNSGKDCEADNRDAQSGITSMGKLLPDGAERKFNQLDSYVWSRLTRWMVRRGGQRAGRFEKWTHEKVWYGFVSIAWNREVPGASHTSKIIVKPCAENCTHGLKGGSRNGSV